MKISKAQELAKEALSIVGLENIAFYRIPKCSVIEIFYVMFIRAMMCKEKSIIIEVPHTIIDNLNELNSAFDTINLLKDSKKVLILDIIENEIYYEGCICNIVK